MRADARSGALPEPHQGACPRSPGKGGALGTLHLERLDGWGPARCRRSGRRLARQQGATLLRDRTMRRDTHRTGVFTRRALLLMGGQAALLGGLGVRLYQVQVAEAARYRTLSDENRISARMIAPPRGRILDRFGVVLAGNQTNWRAVLVAEQTNDVDATLDAFSQILPLADHERARIMREVHRHRRFIPVMVREFLTWDDMARIEVNAPDLAGHRGGCRHHPAVSVRRATCSCVGYVAPPTEADVADDPLLSLPGMRIGRAGLEKYHEWRCAGRPAR